MNPDLDLLDAEELLHLAMRASQQGQHDVAITFLKKASLTSPDNANLCYMLAAEHAEIGLYDRAAAEMERALELAPDMHMARFQLGLLHITAGRLDTARGAWEALSLLGATNALHLLKEGLLELAVDHYDEAIALLEQGMAANNFNVPLNNDMQRMLDSARQLQQDAQGKKELDGPEAGNDGHLYLAAYRDDSDTSS